MDPELEPFMRIKPKPLQLRGTHALADGATCLAVAPAGGLIAAGSYDDEIKVLDEDMNVIGKLEGHPGGANSLAFATEQLLVSAGEDGTAAIWRCDARELKARLACEGVDADRTPDGYTVNHVACSPDQKLAACASGKTVHLFEVAADDVESTRRVFPPISGGVITDLRFTGNDRLLAAFYGGVVIFGVDEGDKGLVLEHGTNILSAAATPDLSWIVGGCMDASVHIWHLQRRTAEEIEQSARGKTGTTTGAESGSTTKAQQQAAAGAAAAGPNGSLTGSGQQNAAPPAGAEYDDDDEEPTPSVIASPDGGVMEMIEFTCGGYNGKVTRVDFGVGAEGNLQMASSGGNACMVWEFSGPGPAGSAPIVTLGHTKPIQCQAWHPKKPGVLVTGGRDGRLILFEVGNAAEGMEEGMPSLCGPAALDPTPTEEVVAVAWSSGGALISAQANGDVKSWTWSQEAP